jgi:hypothetical protein
MKSLIFITLSVLFVSANSVFAVDSNHRNIALLENPERVCWYQGQQYSEGAMIKQFDIYFVCSHKFANQENSRLVWLKANEQGEPVRLDRVNTIRVK